MYLWGIRERHLGLGEGAAQRKNGLDACDLDRGLAVEAAPAGGKTRIKRFRLRDPEIGEALPHSAIVPDLSAKT